jgi:hypothetical protein
MDVQLNVGQSAPLPASTYQLTRTYLDTRSDNIKAEHWYCVPIEEIDREVRVGDLVHVRYKGQDWDLISRVYRNKEKSLAVHVEFTGWRLPLSEVDILGLVVTIGQQFRH